MQPAGFQVLRPLGRGSFGFVNQVKSNETGFVYAAKISRGMGKTLLASEANIHSRMVHPNIIQFVTSFDIAFCPQNPLLPAAGGDCGVILLEFCDVGTLSNVIEKYGVLNREQLVKLTSAMASALLYLREQGVIHRDVKPENILFCNDYAKLGDFGIAKFAENTRHEQGTGTPNYMAYESFIGEYTFATDMYALGVTLYFAYTGRLPFNLPSPKQLMQSFAQRKVDFTGVTRKEGRLPELENLILSMLELQTNKRITPKGVLNHPFVVGNGNKMDTEEDENFENLLITIRAVKRDFGQGSREQFYYYLANRNTGPDMLSLRMFTKLWDKL
jgi:serine/threonine protein kinase